MKKDTMENTKIYPGKILRDLGKGYVKVPVAVSGASIHCCDTILAGTINNRQVPAHCHTRINRPGENNNLTTQ